MYKHNYKHKHKPFTEALSLVSSVTAGKFETYAPLVAETKIAQSKMAKSWMAKPKIAESKVAESKTRRPNHR